MRWRSAALAALAGLALAAPAAAGQAPASGGLTRVTLHTVPRVAGVLVRHRGRIYRTDGRGRVTLNVRMFRRTRETIKGVLAFEPPTVLRSRLPRGVEARFAGFYERGMVIALSLYTRLEVRFVDLQGQPIPARDVGVVRLKSRTGVRVPFRAGRSPTLHASRVQPTQDGPRSKPIEYGVEGVDVRGGNVVNRAQQRFFPLRTRRLTIPLLLYSARFESRDALFGFATGSAVVLTYPGGHRESLPLVDGIASSRNLPRGEYLVQVDAPGYSFERPVALSRDQFVDLQVVSYLDLAVVFSGLAALAIALVLVRRPHYRRFLRRVITLGGIVPLPRR
jgi:hypothetical protein